MASIFASRTTRTIPIPFDPPHEVTIQKLAGRHLEKAKQESQLAASEFLKRMGGAGFQREMGNLGDPAKVAAMVERAQADPLLRYDRLTVLEKGIKGWTYEEALSRETLEDLSEEAADFLARAILALTFPHAGETDEKKSSALSIST